MPELLPDFIDYITGPEKPPMTRRWMDDQNHRHGSLEGRNWTRDPLIRHMTQEHNVFVGIRETKGGLVERHGRMHPEGEDKDDIFG